MHGPWAGATQGTTGQGGSACRWEAFILEKEPIGNEYEGWISILNRVVEEGLMEKMIFKPRAGSKQGRETTLSGVLGVCVGGCVGGTRLCRGKGWPPCVSQAQPGSPQSGAELGGGRGGCSHRPPSGRDALGAVVTRGSSPGRRAGMEKRLPAVRGRGRLGPGLLPRVQPSGGAGLGPHADPHPPVSRGRAWPCGAFVETTLLPVFSRTLKAPPGGLLGFGEEEAAVIEV